MSRDTNRQEKLKQALDRTMIKYGDTFKRLSEIERSEVSPVDPFDLKVDEQTIDLPKEESVSQPSTQDLIRKVCDEVKEMLVKKNISYGDSALNPVRVFSRCSSEEQLKVRIDDKLSRIMRGHELNEDTIQDLIGYLILLKVHQQLNK